MDVIIHRSWLVGSESDSTVYLAPLATHATSPRTSGPIGCSQLHCHRFSQDLKYHQKEMCRSSRLGCCSCSWRFQHQERRIARVLLRQTLPGCPVIDPRPELGAPAWHGPARHELPHTFGWHPLIRPTFALPVLIIFLSFSLSFPCKSWTLFRVKKVSFPVSSFAPLPRVHQESSFQDRTPQRAEKPSPLSQFLFLYTIAVTPFVYTNTKQSSLCFRDRTCSTTGEYIPEISHPATADETQRSPTPPSTAARPTADDAFYYSSTSSAKTYTSPPLAHEATPPSLPGEAPRFRPRSLPFRLE